MNLVYKGRAKAKQGRQDGDVRNASSGDGGADAGTGADVVDAAETGSSAAVAGADDGDASLASLAS
jgi:hypothetical protein